MIEEIFGRKAINVEKALAFGFIGGEDGRSYKTDILDGAFILEVSISPTGSIDTSLTEKETGEEYILYKTTAVGAFVGTVRQAVKDVLVTIADRCFDTAVFKSAQTKELIRYARDRYGDEPEFLWKTTPDNAILRRKDSSKWYGAILTIPKSKLGLDSEEKVEIINLHIQPENMEALLQKDSYYPGWHMNKKSWFTIILDGSVPNEELLRRMDESYRLAAKPSARTPRKQ